MAKSTLARKACVLLCASSMAVAGFVGPVASLQPAYADEWSGSVMFTSNGLVTPARQVEASQWTTSSAADARLTAIDVDGYMVSFGSGSEKKTFELVSWQADGAYDPVKAAADLAANSSQEYAVIHANDEGLVTSYEIFEFGEVVEPVESTQSDKKALATLSLAKNEVTVTYSDGRSISFDPRSANARYSATPYIAAIGISMAPSDDVTGTCTVYADYTVGNISFTSPQYPEKIRSKFDTVAEQQFGKDYVVIVDENGRPRSYDADAQVIQKLETAAAGDEMSRLQKTSYILVTANGAKRIVDVEFEPGEPVPHIVDTGEVKDWSDTRPAGVPGNVKVAAKGKDGVTVTWDATELGEDYSVRFREAKGEWTVLPFSKELSREVSGLAPSKTYEFCVQARRTHSGGHEEAGSGRTWATQVADEWSGAVTIAIAPAAAAPAPSAVKPAVSKPSKPGKVTGVKVKALGKKKALVKWKAAKRAKKYQVAYKKAGAKSWKIKTVSARKVKLSKLKAGKTYKVRVRAVNTKGKMKAYGAWSKTRKVKVK